MAAKQKATAGRPPISIDVGDGMFNPQLAYTLEQLGPGTTRITEDSSARFKQVFKLLGLLFGGKMKADGERVQAENFARMKALLEGERSEMGTA